LATARAQLIADQTAVLEPRRDAACQEQRESRDVRYRELLDQQQDIRGELRWRQDAGMDATPLLNELEDRRRAGQEMQHDFRETGRELTGRERVPEFETNVRDTEKPYDAPVTAVDDVGIDVGDKVGHGVMAFADSLFSDLTNLGSARHVPLSPEERADQFREAAENTLKQHQQHEREEEDAQWRERQRVVGE
jgi:hypothetical protein